jgi:hypothetical protein
MRERRAVHLLHVEPDPRGGASIDLSSITMRRQRDGWALVEEPAGDWHLSAEAIAARDALVLDIDRRERRDPGDGLLVSDRARDARVRALDERRRELDRWELDHVLGPALPRLRRPALLVFHGDSDLRRMDPRASLREGIRAGSVALSTLAEVVCLPTWARTADSLVGHLATLALHGLPEVAADNAVVLLGPPPPDAFLETLARLDPGELRDALASTPREVEALAFRAQLRAEIIEHARRSGLRLVVPEATSRDLSFEAGEPGTALFLVAHQDGAGVHLFDGPIAPAELAARLHHPSGSRRYASVDLSICHAGDSLAPLFQAHGAAVVLTRGSVGYDGSVLVRLKEILGALSSGERCSLPELHDGLWQRGLAIQRPGQSD